MNPSNSQCPQLGSLEYRRLCQTLSQPIEVTVETPRSFTGVKDTDLLILNQMTDKDLINVCAVNAYINNLCNHPSFWLHRVLQKYGKQLGSSKEIKDKYIPDGTSWKDYYLWLSGLLEGPQELAHFIAIENNREDLMIMLDIEPVEIIQAGGLLTVPLYINAKLIGFLREANFGPSDPSNPYSAPLNTYISAITTGISDRYVLTLLFRIYFLVNNMDSNIIIADPLMHQWFEDTFRKLAETPRGFDPNTILAPDLMLIILDNVIKREDRTAEQLARRVWTSEIYERLDNERRLYDSIIKYYREQPQ